MPKLKDFIQLETKMGEPVTAQGVTVTPRAQALTVRIPAVHGGLVWNRPTGVIVERDGQREEMRVVNVNRLLAIGLGVLPALAAILAAVISESRKEKTND